MKERVKDACYDAFLEKDFAELTELCDKMADQVLEKGKLEKNVLLDAFLDVGCAFQEVAFAEGFESCVDVLGALMGRDGKDRESLKSE